MEYHRIVRHRELINHQVYLNKHDITSTTNQGKETYRHIEIKRKQLQIETSRMKLVHILRKLAYFSNSFTVNSPNLPLRITYIIIELGY